MGVTNLWTILAPVKKHKPLTNLKGQVLAVDLSIWVCENQSVKQMHGVVVKPHLRNLFFRVSHLTQLGVKLVFVIEGEAPELKWEEMWRRQQARGIVKPGTTFRHVKRKRSQFSSCLKECCELLDLLGIPHITGHGEAEAMCASLNAAGLVDGCLTDDGDAFLYGAQTVYRNFTMNSKDPHVESYCMSDIQTELGINRQSLVGLSLLLGCDYVPGGVAGVGVANAVKLLKSLAGMDVIQRFKEWKKISKSECLDKTEMSIREKALKIPEFPQQQVVDEFLVSKDRIPKKPFLWKKANISSSQEFGSRKLDWPVEYTLEKVLPLVTLWSMLDNKQHGPSFKQLKPHRIVKSRVRHFIPCFEVEWNKDVWDKTSICEYYTTVEEQGLFTECYPQLVSEYNTNLELAKKNKKKGSKKKPKKDSEMDDLASNLESTSLCTGVINTETVKPVPPEAKQLDKVLETVEKLNDLISVKPKAYKPKGSKLESTCKMTIEKKESSSVSKEVIVPDDIMDVDDDVFIPLSVRIKRKLEREKIKGGNTSSSECRINCVKDLDMHPADCIKNLDMDSHMVSKNLHLGVEFEKCETAASVKSSSENELKILADTVLQKNIHIQVDNIPVPEFSFLNKCSKSNSETSLDTIYSIKPQKIVSSSVSDIPKSQRENEQPVANGVKLKHADVSGKTSKAKKLKLKKRNKSVKKDVLLLDDSVSGTALDSQTIEEPLYGSNSQSEIVLLHHASNDKYTSLKKKDDEMDRENEKVSAKSGIDDVIDNLLTRSLKNLSVAKENSPPMSLQDTENSLSVNNLAKKVLYSAVKKGSRNISTPCNNFLSPHQLKTPNSIGFLNRTADLDFGNFKIQTSLLNSLLQVSNVESPASTIITTNSSTDMIGSAHQEDMKIDQSTPVFEVDSASGDICSSKIVLYSPVIPFIQNDIKMFLDFEQSPCEILKTSKPNMPLKPLAPNITRSETTYCSPAPLSLKDRLKLRLKDSHSQVLKDLSNM